MEFIPTEISRWSEKYLSTDNLARKIFQISKSDEINLTNLQSNSLVQLALFDFYNDIRHYKDAVKNIKKVQSAVASVQRKSKNMKLDETVHMDSFTAHKYDLLQPISFFAEKKLNLNEEFQNHQSCFVLKNLMKCVSSTSTGSCSDSNKNVKSPVLAVKSKKSIIKLEVLKAVLIAEPEIIEFRNYESYKIYKKTIIIRNVGTQLARFQIERRPARSAFTIFVESARKGEKENIAPGMYVKFVVHFRCDAMTEPEELLVLRVQNGKSVMVKMIGRRDPPILRGLVQMYSFASTKQFSESSTSSSELGMHSSECSAISSYHNNDSYTESSELSSNLSPCTGLTHSNFDCKKCFVGEFTIISTVMKNIGGRGRFFIMSEIDWCSMKIEDLNTKNMLIVPPFAVWPAYFTLQPNEQVTLYTYFFPDYHGLQVDEFYIVSDNCSVTTIEVIGEGINFEPYLLQFDKNMKYQWFQTRNNGFCTIRYLDLGSGFCDEVLRTSFSITSKCELDLYFRWEIDNTMLCPAEYKNTVGRKDFRLNQISIEPSSGIFEYKLVRTFNVVVTLNNLVPDHYRCTFRLIIEDVPLAAVPRKYNYSYEESTSKRRLSQNSIDIVFENIEVRIRCISTSATQEKLDALSSADYRGDGLLTMSIMNITDFTNDPFLRFDIKEETETKSSLSDDVCRFIKGYGRCDCCQTTMFSTAVLRPKGPVFLGVETKFTAVLRNRSSKRLKYWWSNAVGPDHTKMKINIEPKFDYILPNSCQIIKIKCLPLETGDITSIFISCQFNSINPLILSIECTVQSLSLSFYFPLSYNDDVSVSDKIRIEWNANEYVSKYDKKTAQIKLLQKKLKEEKLLHTVILNSSESLLKTDSERRSSYENYENEEETLSFQNTIIETNDKDQTKTKTVKIDHNSTDFVSLKESWIDEEESYDRDVDILLPYFDFSSYVIKKHFRYLPLVVEIYVTPGKTHKKRFYLQNESPIASNFFIKTKNFWNKNKFEDDDNDESNELKSEILVTVDPIKGDIKPNEVIYFDIVANSNTWGIYTDQVIINIDLLPPYRFWVRIINNELPISYPICRNSSTKIPKIRFKVFKHGYSSGKRKLLVENTSSIPLYLNWHCFLIDEQIEAKPFNVILDMFTPFISIEEFLAMNPSFYNEIKRFFSCAFNPYIHKDNLAEIDEFNGPFNISSSTYNSTRHKRETKIVNQDSFDTEFSNNSGNISSSTSSKHSTLSVPPNDKTNKKYKETEFELSIIPYYGETIHGTFIITPQELFLPPKEKRYIDISVNTEKLNTYVEKMTCKACGFIRIPPIFKYKDNVFFRKDGYYLPPTEVHLELDIRKPLFFIQSNKDQRTFEFHAKNFVHHMKNDIQCKKTILFTNFDEEILNVAFEINKPFEITRVSTQREVFCNKIGSVHPKESVEIVIKCTITTSWLEKAVKKHYNNNQMSTSIAINKLLSTIYKEGFTQTTEVYLKIHLPTLNISRKYLNFGEVSVGDAKTLTFEVQNLSERPQWFKIQTNDNNNIFTFFPNKALLATQTITPDNSTLTVTASFIPKNPGVFKEIILITSEIDGVVAKCFFEGQGYL